MNTYKSLYHLKHPATLFAHLARHYCMYQVVERSGELLWQVAEKPELDALEHNTHNPGLPLVSPKSLFFAERENLFNFDGECFRETLPQPEPFALFGVQSCDLQAIAYQDQFFAEDPYYQARRQQALLVGLDCLSPCSYSTSKLPTNHGFCAAIDAGPGVKADTADLTLHREATDQWLLLVNNERGQAAIQDMEIIKAKLGTGTDNGQDCLHLLTGPAEGQALLHRQQSLEKCIEQFPESEHIHTGVRALNKGQVPNTMWQSLAQRCLSCSGCTSLCPTCSCYGIRDLNLIDQNLTEQDHSETGPKTTFQRQRFWDSCLYESFQREASQHNPSTLAGERVRRFWQHKFGDHFAEDYGRYGCVGCGRCEQTCPGVLGVHSVMRHISARQDRGQEGSYHA